MNTLQLISIKILNSRHKMLFNLIIISLIYFVFYKESYTYCMNSEYISTETKDEVINKLKERVTILQTENESLQKENTNLRCLHQEDSKPSSIEAEPLLAAEVQSLDSLLMPIEEQNITLRRDLFFARIEKEHAEQKLSEALSLVENHKNSTEQGLKNVSDWNNVLAEQCETLYKETIRLNLANVELQKQLQATQHKLYLANSSRPTGLSRFITNIFEGPRPHMEDKSTQTFSEMAIADALLDSQAKRLKYLK